LPQCPESVRKWDFYFGWLDTNCLGELRWRPEGDYPIETFEANIEQLAQDFIEDKLPTVTNGNENEFIWKLVRFGGHWICPVCGFLETVPKGQTSLRDFTSN